MIFSNQSNVLANNNKEDWITEFFSVSPNLFIFMQEKENKRKLQKSYFITAPQAEKFMKIVREHYGKKTSTEIYRMLKNVDRGIPNYPTFCKWVKKLDKDRQKRVGYLVDDVKNALVNNVEKDKDAVTKAILDSIFNKLFVAGNVAITQELHQIKEQLEQGKALSEMQKKRIMDWVFKGADAMTKQRSVDLKEEGGEREQSLIDNLLYGFQYGKIKRADVIEGEFEPIKELEKQHAEKTAD